MYVCMYVCMHVYVYIYIYIYTYIHTYTHIYICIQACEHTIMQTYIHNRCEAYIHSMPVFMFVCICLYTHISMRIMKLHLHIHTHINIYMQEDASRNIILWVASNCAPGRLSFVQDLMTHVNIHSVSSKPYFFLRHCAFIRAGFHDPCQYTFSEW